MRAERLQLSLLPEQPPLAQPLPTETRQRCIEVIANILLHVARAQGARSSKRRKTSEGVSDAQCR